MSIERPGADCRCQGHAVRCLDRDEMAPFRPRLEIENIGEEFGRFPFVLHRDDRVKSRPTETKPTAPPRTATAKPAMRRRSHGLYGVPWWLFWPVPPNANSTIWVLPTITLNWRRNVATNGLSRSQGSAGRRRLDPAKQGYPPAANRSLTEMGSPWSGPVDTSATNHQPSGTL